MQTFVDTSSFDFQPAVTPEDLSDPVEFVCQNSKFLSDEQAERVIEAIRKRLGVDRPVKQVVEYDASFDLSEEVGAQVMAVRAIRDEVFRDGKIRGEVTLREAKEVIASGSALLTTLSKHHADIVNMDRLRALEGSVIEALQEQDEDFKEKVMALLEEKLEAAAL